MAKIRFLTDPNTFWMDFGTSKISRFFGPVVDPRTPYLSWIYFKKYKKNLGTSLKNMDFGYLRIWESQIVQKSCVPDFSICEISKFEDSKIWRSEILIIRKDEFLKILKSRRRGMTWHSFSIHKMYKSLDANFIPIKKWIGFVKKRTNFSIFKYRLPPLHPIGVGP